jgi:hypothetical protein
MKKLKEFLLGAGYVGFFIFLMYTGLSVIKLIVGE